MGRSKERGIGEAKNAVYPIKDQVKEEDKSKNNKGNLCNPQCFMNTLIKAAKLTRREDRGRLLGRQYFSVAQPSPNGMDTTSQSACALD